MTKIVNLATGRVHNKQEQTVQVNQVVILNHTFETKWVVYKVEHDPRWGYTYHVVSIQEPHFNTADIFEPIRQKFGIGWYYDDEAPEFMDGFEVALLQQQAQQKADTQAQEQRKEKERREQVEAIGRERLKGLIPTDAQAVIIACERENNSDPYTDYFSASTIRKVILGFSTHQKNNFQEMRNYAGNFEPTAHLTENNKEYENRENYIGGHGYYLGESKYSGWIIEKVGIFDRERFIEQYAYTAGDEDNIHIKQEKPTIPSGTQESKTGNCTMVEYSEKALAVFGDTKSIKDELAAMGGRFNNRLTYNGKKIAGWIFPKSKEQRLAYYFGLD